MENIEKLIGYIKQFGEASVNAINWDHRDELLQLHSMAMNELCDAVLNATSHANTERTRLIHQLLESLTELQQSQMRHRREAQLRHRYSNQVVWLTSGISVLLMMLLATLARWITTPYWVPFLLICTAVLTPIEVWNQCRKRMEKKIA